MSTLDNIGNLLNDQFENSNFLPQQLTLEDFDKGLFGLLKNFSFTVENGQGQSKQVPIIFLSKELWAEKRGNWGNMINENGEEISRPFMTIMRKNVKRGESPLKRTIPVKLKFQYVKVPIFNGTLKNYEIYKIPQPTYVDCEYELRCISSYQIDRNTFYEKFLRDIYSDGQGYMKINGYQIRSVLQEPSEDNLISDINSERIFQIIFPITVHGKLVDPTQFERITTVNKVKIVISEKTKD